MLPYFVYFVDRYLKICVNIMTFNQDEDTQLFARYNVDDVFNRSVLGGLLYLLNNAIEYEQIYETNVVEIVHVPFMYDFGSSDERFAQDNYTFFGRSCFGEKKIDGKFDMLPRGVIRYSGSQIDSGSFTNRFVKAKYLVNENGKLTSYFTMMSSIPLSFSIDCEMFIDNIVTAFKIEQSIRETFYKNRTYNVLFRGIRVPCRVGFPESHTFEKTTSYSFDSERQLKLNFSLAIETYQPSFDKDTQIETGNRIEKFAYDINVVDSNTGNRILNKDIKFKNFNNTHIYPSGTTICVEWETTSETTDMLTIIFEYIDEEGKTHFISSPMLNQKFYLWSIPENFSTFVQPNIVFNETSTMFEKPIVKIIPNGNKEISESSFIVVDRGKFKNTYSHIPFTVEYVDKNGKYVSASNYYFNISNGEIDQNDPVTIDGDPLIYTNDVKYRKISLKLVYPLDTTICDQIDNILIL